MRGLHYGMDFAQFNTKRFHLDLMPSAFHFGRMFLTSAKVFIICP